MDSLLLIGIVIALVAVLSYYWSRSRQRSMAQFHKADYTLEHSPELVADAKTRVFSDQDADRVQRMFDQFAFSFSHVGSFRTSPEPAVIQQLVDMVFEPAHHEYVLAALHKYGKRLSEPEKGRIQLDIIKASGGDYSTVNDLVKRAKNDFRDLVGIAESPNFMEAWLAATQRLTSSRAKTDRKARTSLKFDPTTPGYREALDADLRQFGMWLLQYVK